MSSVVVEAKSGVQILPASGETPANLAAWTVIQAVSADLRKRDAGYREIAASVQVVMGS